MPLISLGVGSNIDKEINVPAGISLLADMLDDMVCSPIYESRALGFDGDNFLNCVVAGNTTLTLVELHETLKSIERQYGREIFTDGDGFEGSNPDGCNPRYSAKRLDIDILTYDDLVGQFGAVSLPRNEILSAAFVLKPLSDIWPNRLHPTLKLRYIDLWRNSNLIDQTLWPVTLDNEAVAAGPRQFVSAEAS